MENYEKFFNSICRICLSYGNSENMVSLTDNTTKDGLSFYGKAVHIFTNVSIKNDSLPEKMCAKCLFVLKQTILFKKTCENSNEKLKMFVSKFDTSNSDFKEKLCDYVLFMEIIPNNSLFEASRKRPMKKIGKETKTTMKKSSQNKLCSETDNDTYMDMESDDFWSENKHEIKKEQNITPKTEDNIDNLLTNMEIVAESRSWPREFKLLKKNYLRGTTQYYRSRRIKNTHSHTAEIERKIKPEEKQCKICMKVFSSYNAMQIHMKRHASGNFICEHCGKKFVTIAELNYHLAWSHDVGPKFTCKECGYKAPKRHDIMVHERLHTGERPYACEKCGLTFHRRYLWKKHGLYHLEKTLQCQRCPKKFTVRGELLSHMNNVHERLYVYACDHCDTTYAKTATVRRHMTDKHGVPREMQGKIRRINLGKPSDIWNDGKYKQTL